MPSPICTTLATTIPHSNTVPCAPRRRQPPLHASTIMQAPAAGAAHLHYRHYNACYYTIILQDIKPNARVPWAQKRPIVGSWELNFMVVVGTKTAQAPPYKCRHSGIKVGCNENILDQPLVS